MAYKGDDSEDDIEVTEEVDKPQLHPREALNMLDQIVGMGELEEEECNFINGIIQKFERLVIKKKKQRSIQDYFVSQSL